MYRILSYNFQIVMRIFTPSSYEQDILICHKNAVYPVYIVYTQSDKCRVPHKIVYTGPMALTYFTLKHWEHALHRLIAQNASFQ